VCRPSPRSRLLAIAEIDAIPAAASRREGDASRSQIGHRLLFVEYAQTSLAPGIGASVIGHRAVEVARRRPARWRLHITLPGAFVILRHIIILPADGEKASRLST